MNVEIKTNDLELALGGDNHSLNTYLELVSANDFRADVADLIKRNSSPDMQSFKEQAKRAIDSL